MQIKSILAMICLLFLGILGVNEVLSKIVIVNPVPVDRFEYEFELLNGKVKANPHGLSR